MNAVSCTQFRPERSVRKAGGRLRGVPESRMDFGWITDFEIGQDRLMPLMRAGWARWRVESQVFNVMKAQDAYRFEHNFGQHATFLIDQVQQHCCPLFRKAREHLGHILYRAVAGELGKEDYVGLIRAGP